MTNSIKTNYEKVRERVAKAAVRSGRELEDINIVAVSKTFPLQTVISAVEAGITVFGENRVDEALKKISASPDNLEWHMIGQLQSRKARDVAGKFSLIHSVDRLSLAEKLNRSIKEENLLAQNVLVQIDFTSRDDRGGVPMERAISFMEKISALEHLSVKGLMTLPPWSDNPEETRPYFKKMKELFEKIKGENFPGIEMKYLSMGMTKDFEVAIEEGSNMIRVGRAIFGERG